MPFASSPPRRRGAFRVSRCATRLIAGATLTLAACGSNADDTRTASRPRAHGFGRPSLDGAMVTNADRSPPKVPYFSSTPVQRAVAIASFPHDSTAYTQGLAVLGGRMFESTGLYGVSDIREVHVRTGRAKLLRRLPPDEFAEGIAISAGKLLQLTWQAERGYVRDLQSLDSISTFRYPGEGWGLAAHDSRVFLSDGSAIIRVFDNRTFAPLSEITVSEGGSHVWSLNELEFVGDELWSNIYQTSLIARIDPTSGSVLGYIDLSLLLTAQERQSVQQRGGTANGIAWNPASDVLYVTGKFWPRLFAVDLPGMHAQLRSQRR